VKDLRIRLVGSGSGQGSQKTTGGFRVWSRISEDDWWVQGLVKDLRIRLVGSGSGQGSQKTTGGFSVWSRISEDDWLVQGLDSVEENVFFFFFLSISGSTSLAVG